MQVETAEVQLDVIEEGIDELCSLESYMQRTHPPEESASLLAVQRYTEDMTFVTLGQCSMPFVSINLNIFEM